MRWNEMTIRRLLLDMAGQVMQQPYADPYQNSIGDLDLYRDLGLDSIRRLELAAMVNGFFGVFNTTADHYRLTETRLSAWIETVQHVRREYDETITFLTSGTTGAPRPVTHSMATLAQEVNFLASLLPRPRRIVSSVPSHHIYGFLFTVLLPSVWQVPVQPLAGLPLRELTGDDLLIGTPFTWAFLQTSLGTQSVAWRGISSTAPLPGGLFKSLNQSGIRLTEVYGSSDTGGIAYRHQPDDPFLLFPYLRLTPDDPPRIIRDDTHEPINVPDRLERLSASTLRVLSRLDGAVQVAGVNVYPAHVAAVIRACPVVADCAVWVKAEQGTPQLGCSIRLHSDDAVNREACRSYLRAHLTTAEQPRSVYFEL